MAQHRGWSTPAVIACAMLLVARPVVADDARPIGDHGAVRGLLDDKCAVEAEAAARRLLASAEAASPGDPLDVADALDLLVEALLLGSEGGGAEALATAERAVAVRMNGPRPQEAASASSLRNLAEVHVARGDLVAAAWTLERELAALECVHGSDNLELVPCLERLVTIREDLRDDRGFLGSAERILAIRERSAGTQPRDLASARIRVAVGRASVGDDAGARRILDGALALAEREFGPGDEIVARILGRLGPVLRRLGDLTAARGALERAAGLQEDLGDAVADDHAYTLLQLGYLAIREGAMAKAKLSFEQALALAERTHGSAHPELAPFLFGLSDALERAGDFAGAQVHLERALAIVEASRGPRHPDVAEALSGLASLVEWDGRNAEARVLHERSLAIRREAYGPQHRLVASSLIDIGQNLSELGRHEESRVALQEALAVQERLFGSDHIVLAPGLQALSFTLAHLGDYAGARSYAERALHMVERVYGPDSVQAGQLAFTVGEMDDRLGNNAGARLAYERALATFERVLGPTHPTTAHVLPYLALKLLQDGDHEGARATVARGLAIREQSGEPETLALRDLLFVSAQIEEDAGDLASARRFRERALAITERIRGPEHPCVGSDLFLLAAVLWDMGRSQEAAALLERAIGIQERALPADHPELADAVSLLARIRAESGASDEAMILAARAERATRGRAGDTVRGLSEVEALRYLPSLRESLDILVSVSLASQDEAAQRATFDAVIRSRCVVMDEMAARARWLADAADPALRGPIEAEAATARRLARLLVATADAASDADTAALAEARAAQESAERALAAASEPFRRHRRRASIGFAEVAAALPEDGALVAYVRHARYPTAATGQGRKAEAPDSYSAFVLRPGGSLTLVSLGSAAALDEAVRRWRECAGRDLDDKSAESACRDAGLMLRHLAWDPVASLVGDARLCCVVPDGALHVVNFAALPDDRGAYLLESGPLLHVLTTERSLAEAGREPSRGSGLVALGGPDFDATAEPGEAVGSSPTLTAGLGGPTPWRGPTTPCAAFRSLRFVPLPHASAEAADVAAAWERRSSPLRGGGTAVLLTGAHATEAAVKRVAAGARWLHLATHGFFVGGPCSVSDAGARGMSLEATPGATVAPAPAAPVAVAPAPANPQRLSGLALAGANRRDLAGPEVEDGVLTAEEVATLNLSGVEWAVLSACDTGAGDVMAGEGVLGLRRAFETAGARTVIVSLWAVRDRSARDWMHDLYEARLTREQGTAEAVRDASLAALRARRAAGSSTHPFHWAAFVAAGDWR